MSEDSSGIWTETTEQEAETLQFQISAWEAGARLDAYLAAKISERSRSALQRLIEDGDVSVNNRAQKSSYKLRAGDMVEVELATIPYTSFTPENIPLEIVYEDDAIVVVNKPAGMVVHPAAGVRSGTLANALAFHFQHLSQAAGAARPGIVHRLDKDTSGLIVVARTEEAHENLADQFRAREVFKSYVALAHGRVEKDSGSIDQPIGRDARTRTRMAVVRGGRAALSLYRVRKRYERFTLLEVEIKTGRTHQIRVHLAWLKHPVVGDGVYGGGRDKTVPDVRVRSSIAKLGRQFLHAEQLGFRHPLTGARLHFTSPLPGELSELLEELD
ncbi:MAG TPA: RluA family pseudouridine synthase [Pyrinomonadaceae bacterium]|nr:RluA family pseudouridine synthase [Pyrinomonadaceae bacterium]